MEIIMQTLARTWCRKGLFLLLLWLATGLTYASAAGLGEISDTNKHAWSETSGWLNFKPTGGGVTVHSDHLSGYVWAANAGWIKLCTDGAVAPFGNTTTANWCVTRNSATGALGGYAWGENVGWVTFGPTGNPFPVVTNTITGEFSGYAWSANIGYIHFKNSTGVSYKVQVLNHPPTASARSITANEDVVKTLDVADFGFADVDTGDTLQAVIITSPPSAGSLKNNNSGVLTDQVIPVDDISSGTLTFTPAANANGNSHADFDFMVSDGTDESAAAYTMTVNVTSVNDAPAGTNKLITINEDVPRALSSTDFGFTDPSDSPANSLLAVKHDFIKELLFKRQCGFSKS